MSHLALLKVRMDFDGNRIGEPEIIEVMSGNNKREEYLNKLASVYARLLQKELAEEVEVSGGIKERKEAVSGR